MSKQRQQRAASDFVTPQARYAEHAQDMTGTTDVAVSRPNTIVPLYGLGQDPSTLVVWYRQPIFVLPAGIAVGFGIGWLWFAFMPRMKGRVKAIRNAFKGKD